jgi:hypothetical protein
MLTKYDIINGWNHEYTFCITFFKDEAEFTQSNITNTRNLLLEYENLHEVAECHSQHGFSDKVWCEAFSWLDMLLRDV